MTAEVRASHVHLRHMMIAMVYDQPYLNLKKGALANLDIYVGSFRRKCMKNEIWVLRLLALNHKELRATQHATNMLISEFEEYFNIRAFDIDWLKNPDFTIYPFNERESSSLYLLNEIQDSVTVKGDIVAFGLPDGKTLPGESLLSVCYKEQMVLRIKLIWRSDFAELTQEDIINQINYLASSLSSVKISLLSIEIQSKEASTAVYLNDFIDTITSVRTTTEKKTSLQSWYNLAELPRNLIDSSPIAFSSVLERWSSVLEIREMAPCKVDESEELFNIIGCGEETMAFSTLFIPSESIGMRTLSLITDSHGYPIWVRMRDNIEGSDVSVYSRVLATPLITKCSELFQNILRFPTSNWTGESGGESIVQLVDISLKLAPFSSVAKWVKSGLSIDYKVDENGKEMFDTYIADDDGVLQHFFSGDIIDTTNLFDKMDLVCEEEYVDLNDAILAATLAGYKQESIEKDTSNLYTLQ